VAGEEGGGTGSLALGLALSQQSDPDLSARAKAWGLLGALASSGGTEGSPGGNIGEALIRAIPLVGPILQSTGALGHFSGSGITTERAREASLLVSSSPALDALTQFTTAAGHPDPAVLGSMIREGAPSVASVIADAIVGAASHPLAGNLLSVVLGPQSYRRGAVQEVLHGLDPGRFGPAAQAPATENLPAERLPAERPAPDDYRYEPRAFIPTPTTQPPPPPPTTAQRIGNLLSSLITLFLLFAQAGVFERRQRQRQPLPSDPRTTYTPGGQVLMPWQNTSSLVAVPSFPAVGGGGGNILPAILSSLPGVLAAILGRNGGNGGMPGGSFFDAPFIDIVGQGGAGMLSNLTSPWRMTGAGARAQVHVVANPVSGRMTWFRPSGPPILFADDLRAPRRLARVAAQAGRSLGRRARRGGR
jgi:hypothetical protein